jgi:betaine-aldehyde dehydrogenase
VTDTKQDVPFEGLFIAGDRAEASDGAVKEVHDPSTNAVIARVARATPDDVDTAVRAAHEQFAKGEWRRASARSRGEVLGNLAQLVRDNLDRLAQLESRNAGKPIAAARGEISGVATTFAFYAGAADKVHGQTIPGRTDGTLMTFREPLGVCGAIVPWNFPMLILSWKVAPALAMGNSVVVKPAELTPLTALALAELAIDAGLPKGVLNVLPGSGSTAGDALVRHPLVRKISFTGSTEVGTRVMQAAAEDITRVSLELGGKSASIVFADADLDECVESSISAVYDNAGQDCCARSRVLVERSVHDEFVQRFVDRAQQLRLGRTDDEQTEFGPLISPDQRETVEGYVDLGTSEGATLVTGGQRPNGELSNGNYLTPAVFTDVRGDMRLMREEVFGPVVGIQAFEGEDEAIAAANDSVYGLSGSLWTRELGRAMRVARAVDTGMLSVNSSSSVHIEAPFGGMKQSGLGREQGMVALDHYSEYKTVFIADA